MMGAPRGSYDSAAREALLPRSASVDGALPALAGCVMLSFYTTCGGTLRARRLAT